MVIRISTCEGQVTLDIFFVWIPCLEGAWGLRRPYYIICGSHSSSHGRPLLLILLLDTSFSIGTSQSILQRYLSEAGAAAWCHEVTVATVTANKEPTQVGVVTQSKVGSKTTLIGGKWPQFLLRPPC